jgi:UDP-galactopyranose mutase
VTYDFLIVGAGFAGAIMAERIATQLNKKVLLVEKRNHIGGNAFDEYDVHGVLIHRYGPHIFHTNSKKVLDYLSLFTNWLPYEHKVLAKLNGELYPIPINRLTLGKLYKRDFKNDNDAGIFLDSIKENRKPILNSEDVIVNKVGYDLFNKFFRTYTKKQWDLEPKDLSPSVCGRIPVRTNEDCRYFEDKYQFVPSNGYTELFKRMLSNRNIEVVLNTDYKNIINEIKFNKLIYTGPIDYFFNYEYGKLPYRSIRFEFENIKSEKYQEAVQINYVDDTVEFTRVTEYKFMTGQQCDSTTISVEYPLKDGEPFYPVPNSENQAIYNKYKSEAEKLPGTIFCGRLAEYKYYNMDQVVANTLKIFENLSWKIIH